MSQNFKNYAAKKSNFKEQKFTLDNKHKQIIKDLSKENKQIPKLEKKKLQLQKQLDKLNKIPKKDMSETDFNKIYNLEEQIEDINNKLNVMDNNELLNHYFTETGSLLFGYYQNIQNVADEKSNKKKSKNKGIMSFFGSKNKELEKQSNKVNTATNNPIKRGDISEEYLRIIDPDNAIQHLNEDNYTICSECNIEMTIIQDDGIMVCQNCGQAFKIIIDSDKPSYKEPPREISYFAYKRINHFTEWLNQSQAKETTIIPEEIFDKIREELKKERITKTSKINAKKIKIYLKKLGYSKYYEHTPHIINRINGKPPLVLSPELENKLKSMFREIQAPYIDACPKDRKNFLSYSYTIYKFLELLGYDELKKHFPLLKSREKIHQHDMIWKKICAILKWEYIPSI